MKKRNHSKLNLIYYDLYGNHVGRHTASIKGTNLPTHHLKNLIHRHFPYGYQITYNFVYPQNLSFQNKNNSDLYIAVQEQAI